MLLELLATIFPPMRILLASFFTKGYGVKKCITDLKRHANRINNAIMPNNRIGRKMAELQLARMERTYYIYRIANLKYNRPVIEGSGTSSGVLAVFRELLKGIILNESVSPQIKKKAVSILLAQQSNRTLYEIARSDRAIGQMIDARSGISVAGYIIHHFPANADHDLINLAFYWANKSASDLTTRAISRITSPKSLLTLCLFFHDNHNNMQYVKYIINQLGSIIDENAALLQADGIDYVNENCDIEANWLDTHAKSMIFSAHMALSKVVVSFADENTIIGNNNGLLTEERGLVEKAIETMTVPSFLQRIIQSNKDGFKVARCEAHRDKLTGFTISDEVRRDRLIMGVCTDQEMIEAILNLDLRAQENLSIAHTLAKRLEYNQRGIVYSPKLSPTVGHVFCEKYYGSHQFQPAGDGANGVEVCLHCGLKRFIYQQTATTEQGSGGTSFIGVPPVGTSIPPFPPFWWAFTQQGFPGYPPNPNVIAAPPGQQPSALPPADPFLYQVDVDIKPDE